MDLSLMFCGFVFGVIGFWLFKQGKKDANIFAMLIGAALMIYPYFIENIWIAWITGIALCGLAYLKK